VEKKQNTLSRRRFKMLKIKYRVYPVKDDQEILAKIEKCKKGIDPETIQREDQRIRNGDNFDIRAYGGKGAII
jgi:hypothetical protein